MATGVLLALGSSLCWACANVAIQRAGRAVGPWRAMLWAQVVGIAGVAVFAPLFDERTAALDAPAVAWWGVAGLAAVLAYVSLFVAFERAQLSVAVPIMSCWPAIAAGVSLLVFGQRLRAMQAVGAGIVLLGVVLVAVQDGSSSAGDTGPPGNARRTLLASLSAAVGFGVLVPAIDRIAPALGRFGAIGAVFALDLMLGIPMALLLGKRLTAPDRASWPAVLGSGFFETLGFVCINLASARAPIGVVAPAASLAAAFTVLYAAVVLRERPTPVGGVGAALACLGVIVLALQP